MSHVDDGTLHAYLDGELSPVERSRLDAHLADCASCRDRLEEERSLIERADRLLGQAAPPAGRPVRPLSLPGSRRRPRYAVAGIWAASIAAAFVAGWLLRPGAAGRQMGNFADTATSLADANVPAVQSPASGAAAPEAPAARDGLLRRSRATTVAVADSSAATAAASAEISVDRAARKTLAPVPGMVGGVAQPALRGGAPTPVPPAAVAIGPPPSLYETQSQARAASAPLGTTWVAIEAGPARKLLGTDVVTIPGIPVRDILRNSSVPGAVLVEQEVAEGTVIQLLQSRLDQAAGPARADALRRTVGSVEVRISGPLSTDSLLKLLDLAR